MDDTNNNRSGSVSLLAVLISLAFFGVFLLGVTLIITNDSDPDLPSQTLVPVHKVISIAKDRKLFLADSSVAMTSDLPKGFCKKELSAKTNNLDREEYVIQVIYAYPKGAPNRFKSFKNIILADVRYADSFYKQESQGKRSIAWDLGGPCGSKSLDILSIELPLTVEQYENMNYSQLTGSMTSAGSGLPRENKKHYMIYVDGIPWDSINALGFAEVYEDRTPSITNANNFYPNSGFVLAIGPKPLKNHKRFEMVRRETFIHELTHTLGSVLSSSPHATTKGHCRDEFDVMCYNDDGKGSYVRCSDRELRLDCKRDTYFSLKPTGWLSKNWNTADSPYLKGSPIRP